jgi:hypothetical protein
MIDGSTWKRGCRSDNESKWQRDCCADDEFAHGRCPAWEERSSNAMHDASANLNGI